MSSDRSSFSDSSDSDESDGENMSMKVVTEVLESKAKDIQKQMQEMVNTELENVKREVRAEIEGIRKDLMSIGEKNKVFEERLVKLETFTEKQEFDKNVAGAIAGKIYMFSGTLDQVFNTVPRTTAHQDNCNEVITSQEVHDVQDPPSDVEMSMDLDDSVRTDRSGGSSIRSKFSWQSYKDAETFVKKFCQTNNYRRAEDLKKECYNSGCEQELWPKETKWQIRVYYKIDSVCRAATLKLRQQKKQVLL